MIITIACTGQANNSHSNDVLVDSTVVKSYKAYTYEELSLIEFLKQLYINHGDNYQELFIDEFDSICDKYDLDNSNEHNKELYFKIHFYHRLFTSGDASNGNTEGGILKIPYFWHWVEPNPRYQIKNIRNNKFLTEITPGDRFTKYDSFADIDRIPSQYLSDLITESPQYYHELCGEFYTFGWCSEREMAFTLLMNELLDATAEIIVYGAHSWTEISATFIDTDAKEKIIFLEVDNTYDAIELSQKSNEYLNDERSTWYKNMAHSEIELAEVNKLIVNNEVSMRVENLLNNYFKHNFNIIEP